MDLRTQISRFTGPDPFQVSRRPVACFFFFASLFSYHRSAVDCLKSAGFRLVCCFVQRLNPTRYEGVS
jgi:hypothetical protein